MALSILIADDNDLNRWLLAEQLRVFDVEVVQAVNGAQAWDLLRDKPIQLALIDLNMPQLSGIELVRKLRAEVKLQDLPCAAVTAHADDGIRQRLLSQGFDDCLIKPIAVADLRRIVEPLLGLDQQADEALYAERLLGKVEQNRALAGLLLDKLFEQVPEQIAALDQQLLDKRFQQAWEIAHRLHGTFCFVGFEDFRALALVLEQSLAQVADDGADARRQLSALEKAFQRLSERREQLIEFVKQ